MINTNAYNSTTYESQSIDFALLDDILKAYSDEALRLGLPSYTMLPEAVKTQIRETVRRNKLKVKSL